MDPFPAFGPSHLAILAAVPAAAGALALLVRRRPGAARPVRLALAALLASTQLGYLVYSARQGWIAPPHGLPLELCDVAGLLAVGALAGGPALTGELLYYVALAGSSMALLTPDLGAPFPSFAALMFFVLHGGTVVAALFLPWSGTLRPRPGSWWRALLAVNAYGLALLAVNFASGTNYMYLRWKPAAPTLLDHLGPWPWYLLSGEVVAAALFFLLHLPFRRPPAAGQPSS
jgi:hypothetical integral membrane protein (TIGR02206 family)